MNGVLEKQKRRMKLIKAVLSVYGGMTVSKFEELFGGCAERGCGVELNFGIPEDEKTLETVLRPYKIAKAMGCKFYFGSDAHHVSSLENAKARFEKTIDLLDLKEIDKFII